MPRTSIFRAALAAAALVAASGAAHAITLENYQKYRADSRDVRATYKSLIEIRVEGVLQGLVLASRRIAAAGGKPLLCPPADLRIRGAEVLTMLDEELKTPSRDQGRPYPPTTNIEDVLVSVAERRWPCAR